MRLWFAMFLGLFGLMLCLLMCEHGYQQTLGSVEPCAGTLLSTAQCSASRLPSAPSFKASGGAETDLVPGLLL